MKFFPEISRYIIPFSLPYPLLHRITGIRARDIYIAKALLLATGLDGVKRKIEPIPPTTENVDEMTGGRRRELSITQLPTSLEQSLNHLEGDDFIQCVLGKEMVGIFLDVKRREYRDFLEAKAKGPEEERR